MGTLAVVDDHRVKRENLNQVSVFLFPKNRMPSFFGAIPPFCLDRRNDVGKPCLAPSCIARISRE
jgi:hypothetical protein